MNNSSAANYLKHLIQIQDRQGQTWNKYPPQKKKKKSAAATTTAQQLTAETLVHSQCPAPQHHLISFTPQVRVYEHLNHLNLQLVTKAIK